MPGGIPLNALDDLICKLIRNTRRHEEPDRQSCVVNNGFKMPVLDTGLATHCQGFAASCGAACKLMERSRHCLLVSDNVLVFNADWR
jgi:hypothetical protein